MIAVFRPPLWLRVVQLILFGGLALALTGGGLEEGGWVLPLALTGSVLTLACGARLWVIRIILYADRLLLINLFRTVVLPWGEVAKAGHDEQGLWVRDRDYHEYRPTALQVTSEAFAFVQRATLADARAAAARINRIRKKRS
ncbi:hypothetical protein FB565_008220 [Actinoplanes lutulentus]|uniref:PH (Pleckstrin Homology) domain-containing protein n=1 Tax=Actinoplanes lutulentus TaxID=1287878 RepID=A0A327ZDR9_9ACTN|nr:hypothetical protein [Actinoplanes lutulentus]MBB2948437.1 hypothetical protein [Actinoplanes lutulentus]RAK34530.1 hypothetical protein B0I29_111129 [Actinoplanes lutulentus]